VLLYQTNFVAMPLLSVLILKRFFQSLLYSAEVFKIILWNYHILSCDVIYFYKARSEMQHAISLSDLHDSIVHCDYVVDNTSYHCSLCSCVLPIWSPCASV